MNGGGIVAVAVIGIILFLLVARLGRSISRVGRMRGDEFGDGTYGVDPDGGGGHHGSHGGFGSGHDGGGGGHGGGHFDGGGGGGGDFSGGHHG